MNGCGAKFEGDAQNLKINYKYINEFNKVVEISMTLDKYCRMISRSFNGLTEMLKKDMEKNKELKKKVAEVNNMIVQLGKNLIEI